MKKIIAQRKVAHILLIIFTVLGSFLLLWYIWPDETETTRMTNNKTLEIEAAQEKNPAKCEQITGPSYIYNATQQKIVVNQDLARSLCRQNIEKNSIPTL